jgi:hypothetical protein
MIGLPYPTRLIGVRKMILETMKKVLFILLLFLAGCASTSSTGGYITIDDFSGFGYKVIEVDGRDPVRGGINPIVTYVPYIRVAPGTHRLSLKRRPSTVEGDGPEHQDIQVSVESGKSYRLRWNWAENCAYLVEK